MKLSIVKPKKQPVAVGGREEGAEDEKSVTTAVCSTSRRWSGRTRTPRPLLGGAAAGAPCVFGGGPPSTVCRVPQGRRAPLVARAWSGIWSRRR